MAISNEELIKLLQESQKSITNARIRRRRVRNAEGDDMPEDFADMPAEDAEADAVDEGEANDTILLEVKTDQPVEVDSVEVVEDAGDVGGDEDFEDFEEGEEEAVENRRYRRIKNARLVRLRNGRMALVVPRSATRRVKNTRRRYRTRAVTRNLGFDGGVDGTYAGTLKTEGIDSWATVENKARAYDRLVQKAAIKNTIDQAIEEAVKKATEGVDNCKTRNTRTKVRNARGRFLRFKNFRRVRNDDGTIEIIIDTTDPGIPTDLPIDDTTDLAPVEENIPAADVDMVDSAEDLAAPVVDAEADYVLPPDSPVEGIDIFVDGEEVSSLEPIENRRRMRVRNARRRRFAARNRAVHNQQSEDKTVNVNNSAAVSEGTLSIPSTFPNSNK